MKLELYPTGANSVLMRIENIADTFDSDGQLEYETVDVQGLADDLFALANNDSALTFTTSITETSLSANQSYSNMKSSRLVWNTVDGPSTITYPT